MENKLSFYNTLTRKVEQFIPNEEGKVAMYTCGPTVYHFAHIGNLRSYIMEDLLEKTLRYVGYDVKRVMNITDVGHLSSDADTGEDKMLKGAKREHKTVMEIAKFYTDAFFSDCSKLNIKTPDVVEPATNCIDEFINMIKVLMEKGYAYESGGNIYFDTSKLEEYYVFSSQSEKELLVGVRDDVDEDENKRNKSGAFAHGLQLAQPEFIADGEGDEAQGRLGQHLQGFHLLQGVEAQAGQTEPANAEGPQQQTGHQIGGHRGQMQQLGHPGQQKSAHQRGSETNQIGFHNIPSLIRIVPGAASGNCRILAPGAADYKSKIAQSFPSFWKIISHPTDNGDHVTEAAGFLRYTETTKKNNRRESYELRCIDPEQKVRPGVSEQGGPLPAPGAGEDLLPQVRPASDPGDRHGAVLLRHRRPGGPGGGRRVPQIPGGRAPVPGAADR